MISRNKQVHKAGKAFIEQSGFLFVQITDAKGN